MSGNYAQGEKQSADNTGHTSTPNRMNWRLQFRSLPPLRENWKVGVNNNSVAATAQKRGGEFQIGVVFAPKKIGCDEYSPSERVHSYHLPPY